MSNARQRLRQAATNVEKKRPTTSTPTGAVQNTERDIVPSSPPEIKLKTTIPGTLNWQGGKAYYTDTSIYPRQVEVHNPLDVSKSAINLAATKAMEESFNQKYPNSDLKFTNYKQTSAFGKNNGLKSSHNGIDYATPMNTPVGAIANGTVIQTGNVGTYGNLVKVRYDDGNIGYYSHLNSFNVKAGDKVRAGDILGTSGNTGRSTGPHLHLEVRGADDSYYNQIDPQKYIDMYNPQPYKAPEPLYYDFKTGGVKPTRETPVEIPIYDKKTITLNNGVKQDIDNIYKSMSSEAVKQRNLDAKTNALVDYLTSGEYNNKVGSNIINGKLITPESLRYKLPVDVTKNVGNEKRPNSTKRAEVLKSEVEKMGLQGEELKNALDYTKAINPTFGKDVAYIGQSSLAGMSSAVGGTIDALVTAPIAKEIERVMGLKEYAPKGQGFIADLYNKAKAFFGDIGLVGMYAIVKGDPELYRNYNKIATTTIKERYSDKNVKENGFKSAEEMAKADISKMYGMTDFFDKPANKLAFKQIGVSDGAKFTGELAQTISYMIPSIAASLITKNPNFAMGLMSTSAVGNGAKEAYKNGATAEQAYYNGLLKGATEYLTEKMFGGIPFLGKGILGKNADDIIERLSKGSIGKFLNSSYGKIVMELLERGGEGVEEAVSGLASGYIDRLTYDDNAELATAKEIGRDAFLGILVSFVMNAPMDVVKGISNISEKGIKTTTPSEPKTTSEVTEQTNLAEDVPVLTEAVSEVPAESPRNTENIEPAQSTFEPMTEVETDTALTPQEAQVYNIITSNLKRRAEESGILTRDVMERLQNVNAYNPSVSDIKTINNEMHSMFDGTEDAEINGYLNSLDRTLEKAEARNNTQTTENAEADLTPSLPLNTENSTSMTQTTEDSLKVEPPSNVSETPQSLRDSSPTGAPLVSDNVSKLMRGEKVNIKDMSADEISRLEEEYGFKIKKQKQLDNIADRKALELRLKQGEQKLDEEIFNKNEKAVEDKSEEALFSVKHIVGKNKDYGNGVLLDTDLFDKVKPRNWNTKLADFVYKNLAGKSLTVYDEKGNAQKIEFAKAKERVKKDGTDKDHLVINKLARIKGNINTLSVVHIDELLETSQKFDENNENSHQWMDEKGWEHRKAYLEDINGNIYETTLNIARARDGRNILYALSNTKRVEDGTVSSTSNEEGLAHNNNSLKKSITHSDKVVKEADRKKVENIAKVLNREVEWYNDETAVDDMERNSNGVFIPGDNGRKPKIRINENAENPYTVVLGHECFHSLDEKTKKRIIDFIYKNTDTTSEKYQNWKKSIEDAYKANNKTLSEKTLKEEFAAENMQQFFDNEEFLNRLKNENKSVYDKIKQWVNNLFVRFKNKGIFDLNAAAKASDLTDRQLRKLASMFEVGLKPSPSLRDTSPKVRGLERKYDIKTEKRAESAIVEEDSKETDRMHSTTKGMILPEVPSKYKAIPLTKVLNKQKIELYLNSVRNLERIAKERGIIESEPNKYIAEDLSVADMMNINNTIHDYFADTRDKAIKERFFGIDTPFSTAKGWADEIIKREKREKKEVEDFDEDAEIDETVDISEESEKNIPPQNESGSAVTEDFFDEAGAVDDGRPNVLLRMPEPPAESIKTRIEAVIDYATRKLVDSGNAFAKIGKIVNDNALYSLYDLAKRGRTSAMYCIEKAQKDINGKTVGKSLAEIFQPVLEKGDEYHREFSEYLFHMHNIDRMKMYKPVFGRGVTAKMSRAEAERLLKKHPEFADIADEVYDYANNELQYAADSGLISKSYLKWALENYPHYVPTYRYRASQFGGKRRGKKNKGLSDFSVTAAGGDEKLMPIYEALKQKTLKGRNQGQINVLLNRVLTHAMNDKEKMAPFISRVTVGENETDDVNTYEFYRNGKKVTLHVSDSLMEGIKSLSADYKELSEAEEWIVNANNIYKASITSWHPAFIATNMLKDIQDASIYSKDFSEFSKAYPKAWKEMKNDGEMWQLYCYLGGFDSGIFDEQTGLPIQHKGLKKFTDKINVANYLVEQAPRFAEFLATVENGGMSRDNLAQAMLNSANVTVNFNRSGTLVKALNKSFVPFLNPSVQGVANTFRVLKENKDFKDWGKLALKAVIFGVAPAIINNLLYWDDEDYQNLNQRDKDTNYIFKIPNWLTSLKIRDWEVFGNLEGKFLKIPKGRFLSSLGASTNIIIDLARSKDVDVDEYLSLVYDNLGPVNPLTSNIATPIILASLNRTWYGGDIEPQGMATTFDYQKYDASTSAIAKGIGRVLDISPMRIDYVLDSYSGVFGDFILPMTSEKGATNIFEPFTKKFVIDPVYSNRISNDYYNKKNYWEKMKNNIDNDKQSIAAVISRYLNSCSNAVSNLNKEIRELEALDANGLVGKGIDFVKIKTGIGEASGNITKKEKLEKLKEVRVIKNATLKTMTLQLPDVVKSAHKLYSEADLKEYIAKYGKDGEQKYIDYLYREMNKKTFGAEYALQIYNKDTYKKAQKVYKEGVSYDSFYNCYFGFKELGEDATNDDKRAWLMDSKEFSSGEKAILDKNLISRYSMIYNDRSVDYSNEESFILTQMSDAAQRKKSRFPNMSAERYNKLYEAYSSGQKKADKIKNLVEAGMTYTAAEQFYKTISKK